MQVDLTGLCTHESLTALHGRLTTALLHMTRVVLPEHDQAVREAVSLVAGLMTRTAVIRDTVRVRFLRVPPGIQIALIRLFRDVFDLGLRDAKLAVDNLYPRLLSGEPMEFPGLTREKARVLQDRAARALQTAWWRRKGTLEWEAVPAATLNKLACFRSRQIHLDSEQPIHLREEEAKAVVEELGHRPVDVESRPVFEVEVL